jgi:hypothetical protein
MESYLPQQTALQVGIELKNEFESLGVRVLVSECLIVFVVVLMVFAGNTH